MKTWLQNKFSNLWNSWFKKSSYTLPPPIIKSEEELLEQKLYRLFKQKYCEFFPGRAYGERLAKSNYIYYRGCEELNCERFLIGEVMYGEEIISFFKRKELIPKTERESYSFVIGDIILAKFDKEWVNVQGEYQ